MAQDDELSQRFRKHLTGIEGITEKRMMGGQFFFLHGNMLGGADKGKTGERRFMFRVGKANIDVAQHLGGGEMVILADRQMPGFYFVGADTCGDSLFGQWRDLALSFAAELPRK